MASDVSVAAVDAGEVLDDNAWETLVDSIVSAACTPFLGAGVAYPYLPTGKQLAEELAAEYAYPLGDATNLARVTQYLATVHQPAFAKRRVQTKIVEAQNSFMRSREGLLLPRNYQLLAQLDLPVFITTNYDDFLERALASKSQSPRVELCRWNDQLCEDLPRYSSTQPTPGSPLVFHLHGHLRNALSLLVTEDDYIDFTVSLGSQSRNEKDPVIPHWVRRALSRTTLLFIGYSLEDWNFRVLMRYLMKQQRILRSEQSFSLSIQLPDTGLSTEHRQRAARFLADYLGTAAIRVHWGPAAPFLEQLTTRLRQERV